MKYPCYQLAQGRQVIANYKAQGKFISIEGVGEIDEISNRLYASIDAHL